MRGAPNGEHGSGLILNGLIRGPAPPPPAVPRLRAAPLSGRFLSASGTTGTSVTAPLLCTTEQLRAAEQHQKQFASVK